MIFARTRVVSLFLLTGVSALVLMAAPAVATDAALSEPVVEEAAPAEVSQEPESPATPLPSAAEAAPSCDGLAQTGGDILPAFYTADMARTERSADGFFADTNAGALSVEGKLYTLVRAELPRAGEFALSGVRFDHHIRLLHKSADGAAATLIVPLVEGAPNLAVEALLSPARAEGELDLASLLEGSHAYARMDTCAGGVAEPRLVLARPVQISTAQIEKIRAAF